MFGKLKNKLKSWIKNSKDEITKVEETKKEKKKEKPKKEKKPKISKKDEAEILSEKSPEKVKKVLEEKSNETAEDVSKRIEKVKEEEVDKELKEKAEEIEEEVPKEFNAGLKKYEPDLAAIAEREKELEQEIEKQSKKVEKKGFFSKIKSKFSYKITKEEFDKIFEDLEMLLLENNVALEVVEDIESKLSEKLIDKEINQEDLEEEIKSELKSALNEILIDPDDPLEIIKLKSKEEGPFVILFFGINGTGKTTSIAKLTNLLKKNNLTVALAAADTFRAASIEQIQIHADKLKVPLIKHDYGVDPSAVGFDAIKYAKKHKIDVVLIDTAGRMHTKTNLLAEMEKIVRVTNPDLKIFVAESIAGNDATEQAKSFHEMIEIDGAILSKADIDDKGGTIISVSHTTHKPIFYLGTGQEYDDLKLFDKQKFIEDLGL
jgi:fused signal recognition particle receptor